jgi:hypothetical protein
MFLAGVCPCKRLYVVPIELICSYIFEINSMLYVLSFACAKERTKEKHTGNDIQPLPDALIKLQYYC